MFPVDGGTPDGAVDAAADAGDDGGVDAGTDAGGDAGTDAGVDAEAPIAVTDFSALVAREYCSSLGRCCYGIESADAGAPIAGDAGLVADSGVDAGGVYDRGLCEGEARVFGFEGSNLGAELAGDGRVDVDQDRARECLSRLRSLTCFTPQEEFRSVRSACFAALRGTLTSGSCTKAIECAPGYYCKTINADAGARECRPLAGPGESCPELEFDEACSYRASGDTNRYCRLIDPTGTPLDPSAWTCEPSVDNGAQCAVGTWCAQGICDFGSGVCSAQANAFTGDGCKRYIKYP